MPLINQYFKNHCLYFLSTPAKVLGSGGHSSNKEKEMIARCSLTLLLLCYMFHTWLSLLSVYRLSCISFHPVSFPSYHSIFCKMSALVRHRVSLFGKIAFSQSFALLSVCLIYDCVVFLSLPPSPLFYTCWSGCYVCTRRNGCSRDCELPPHSGTLLGCSVSFCFVTLNMFLSCLCFILPLVCFV